MNDLDLEKAIATYIHDNFCPLENNDCPYVYEGSRWYLPYHDKYLKKAEKYATIIRKIIWLVEKVCK